jgi:hypothetical protein
MLRYSLLLFGKKHPTNPKPPCSKLTKSIFGNATLSEAPKVRRRGGQPVYGVWHTAFRKEFAHVVECDSLGKATPIMCGNITITHELSKFRSRPEQTPRGRGPSRDPDPAPTTVSLSPKDGPHRR